MKRECFLLYIFAINMHYQPTTHKEQYNTARNEIAIQIIQSTTGLTTVPCDDTE